MPDLSLVSLLLTLLALAGVVVLLVRRPAAPDWSPLAARLDALDAILRRLETSQREEASRLREEIGRRLDGNLTALLARQDESRREATAQIEAVRSLVAAHLQEFRADLAAQMDRVRHTLDTRLAELQQQNAAKLDEMRQTVDQRLQTTLEQRLGESFKVVSDNLERVSRSLGEMQQMAASVGDLKRVLTNVKTRGTWGEVQLGTLLEQILTPDQYAANVAPRPGSPEHVEFAIKLPGKEAGGAPVWLPIDAKFPVEDYERLVAASERADAEAVTAAAKALGDRVKSFARDIAQKYLAPPHTTDFGVLFLPTEGLYAELLRQPGLADTLQREHRVIIAGPTTLAALLNSLQMGFRTLAIQERASEVWKVLGAVKTEFGKFGEALDNVQKRLEAASKEIEQTGVRSRAISRQLRSVEALAPAPSPAEISGPNPPPDRATG